MKPLCIDLFCGYGGWARGFLDAGYRVIGFDNEPKCAKRYPGEFVLADVRALDGRRFAGARVIVASPPCTEFSIMRELGRHRLEHPDMSCVDAVFRIRKESGTPTVMENVSGLARLLPGSIHRGSYYLWGDVPSIFPTNAWRKLGGTWGWSKDPRRYNKGDGQRERAIIPYPLARALAEACL